MRFQLHFKPCLSIFQVAFAIFGTVFSSSPTASSNSTPALAEPAAPTGSWGPLAHRRRNTRGSVPAGVSLAVAGGLGLQGPRRHRFPNTESRPSVSGRDSERSRDRMSERWLLPKSHREGYGVRGDAGRALVPLYPSREKSAAGGQTATGAHKRPCRCR